MLENFQVIEIKKTVAQKEAPLNVIVEPKRIRFVKAVVEVLGYPAYVRFLFNPETRQFAVQVGKGNESNTVKLKDADYELCCVLLTMLLREDHFSNGSFESRYRAGQVKPIVEKMITLLSSAE